MLNYMFFAGGLALLIKGADFLVAGSSSFARRRRVSELAIGLTIVAFGTSTPELIVSITAGLRGTPDIVIGNVVGSNIFNILVILGLSAVITPLRAQASTVWREIPFALLAAAVVSIQFNDRFFDQREAPALDRGDGLVLFGIFIVFLYYVALSMRTGVVPQAALPGEIHGARRSSLEIVGGLMLLVLGGHFTLSGAIGMAQAWGMSERFIGLTIVAAGTSLPELATSAVAAYRKNADIAIGNIVGSNIFNVFIVLGVPAVIFRVPFDEAANFDLLFMNVVTVILLVVMFGGRLRHTIERWEGVGMLGLYVAYTAYLIARD